MTSKDIFELDDKEIEKKIRLDLRNAFPDAVFQVTYIEGDLSIQHIGGNNYKEVYPTKERVIDAMVDVIRETLPFFEVLDYD